MAEIESTRKVTYTVTMNEEEYKIAQKAIDKHVDWCLVNGLDDIPTRNLMADFNRGVCNV